MSKNKQQTDKAYSHGRRYREAFNQLTEADALRLIQEVLRFRKQAHKAERDRLEASVRSRMDTPGVADPFRKPTKRLAEGIYEICLHDDELVETILEFWAAQSADFQITRQPTDEPLRIIFHFQHTAGHVSSGTMRPARPVTRASTSLLASADTDQRLAAASDGRWRHWLAELESIPADSDIWESVDDFTAGVLAIAARKLEARGERQLLREALARLPVASLAYFEVKGADAWSADACPLGDCLAMAGKVQHLGESLEQHRACDSVRPANRSERRELEDQRRQIEDDVVSLSVEIAACLAPIEPDGPPDPPDHEPVGTEVTQSRGAGDPPSSALPLADVAASDDHAGTIGDQPSLVRAHAEQPSGDSDTEMSVGGHSGRDADEIVSTDGSCQCAVQDPTRRADLSPLAARLDVKAADLEPSSQKDVGPGWPLPPVEQFDTDSAMTKSDQSGSQTEVISADTFADEGKNLERTLLEFIERDDVSGAYWIARSLEWQGVSPTVPSWLLEALQAGRWLEDNPDRFELELVSIAQRPLDTGSVSQALFGSAATLYPALVMPRAGLQAWLQSLTASAALQPLPHLTAVQRAIEMFSNAGIALRRYDLEGVANAAERADAVTAAAGNTQDWLDRALDHSLKYAGAQAVWKRLVQPGGDLYEMLMLVAENRIDRVEEVGQGLERWQTEAKAGGRIDRLWREFQTGGSPSRIHGRGRQQLLRYVDEGCQLASTWRAAVERDMALGDRGDWWRHQVQTLWTTLSTELPAASEEIGALIAPESLPAIRASAACLAQTLQRIGHLLKPRASSVNSALPLVSSPGPTDSLMQALARRLIWTPTIELDEDGLPSAEDISRLGRALIRAPRRDASAAIDGWLERQDFRFLDDLLPQIGDERERERLERKIRAERRQAQAGLAQKRDDVREQIGQALVDGFARDQRCGDWSAEIDSLAIDRLNTFREAHERLDKLMHSVEDERDRYLIGQRRQWDELQNQLMHSHLAKEHCSVVAQRFEAAFTVRDIHLIDEYLSQTRGELDGAPISEIWTAASERRNVLAEFEIVSKLIQSWGTIVQPAKVVGTAAQAGDSLPWVDFSTWPLARRNEVKVACDTWQRLNQSAREATGVGQARAIADLLRFIGFRTATAQPVERVEYRPSAKASRFRATMSADRYARPIPQFGSRMNDQYAVVCVWEWPGADAIGIRLRELGLTAEPTLVICFEPLTAEQRLNLMRATHEQGLGIVVLDEVLLAFIAGEKELRLPVFLRTALPYGWIVPYDPAGPVAPEMFFGRDDMASKLQQPNGACLVYGGRQLGKSALLEHVRLLSDHPDDHRYAWTIDLIDWRNRNPRATNDELWNDVCRHLTECGLLRSGATEPADIIDQIAAALATKPGWRVLILCDEADQFLSDDAREGFRQIVRLRSLMERTNRRFKMVFAGLHDVQRFQAIPNQPLAHFAPPICVGPLEPRATRDLVREPMETLGFRFRERETVLRILAYTNYHPGLIQHFCGELLEHLRRRTASHPPVWIEHADVEAVYRKDAVRRMIQNRFDLTLRLDERYQAIALILAADQLDRAVGVVSSFRADELLLLAREDWPSAFSQIGTDAFDGLLHEMVGLGILVMGADHRFRLRSPNVARLLGSSEQVAARRLRLGAQPSPPEHPHEHDRLRIDDHSYSPLTIIQARQLHARQFGVGLIFASAALGLNQIPDAIDQFVPRGTGAIYRIPVAIQTADALRGWLDEVQESNPAAQDVIAWQSIPALSPAELASLVDEANELIDREALRASSPGGDRDRSLQIVFVFDPAATLAWLSLPSDMRARLEGAATVVVPQRWDVRGLRTRLEREKKESDDAVVDDLLRITGGWPSLVDAVLSRCGAARNPATAAAEVEAELGVSDSALQRQFREDLGIDGDPLLSFGLHFLAQNGGAVPVELMTPEMLEREDLTAEDCQQAVDFLARLRCVDIVEGQVTVEPTVLPLLQN